MDKTEVIDALRGVADARHRWAKAQRNFSAGLNKVMFLLLNEAARNYMSVEEVCTHSGMTRHQVRNRMKAAGLHPNNSKTLLAEAGARALTENAELLGITPADMDLMSPLAYLPMGDDLKQALLDKQISKVTEIPDVYEAGTDKFNPEYLAYLGSLETEAGKGTWRVSRDSEGKLVRIEIWTEANAYLNFVL